MGDGAEPLQSDLRCGAFNGVNRAEKFVDFFRIVVAFEREQAVTDDLQMLFRLRLEELQNFRGYFVVDG